MYTAITRGFAQVSAQLVNDSLTNRFVAELGIDESRAAYLNETGHMSGVDPLLALDRAARAGDLRDGELVLLLAAGTGYSLGGQCRTVGR